MRFFPDRVKRKWELKRLREIENIIQCKVDVIWNFDAFQFRFLHKEERGSRKHIFHLMDYPNGADIVDQASRCDLAIGVTKGLVDLLNDSGAKNTVHLSHSFAPRPTLPLTHSALSCNRLKVACIGNLSIRPLDLNALLDLASENQEVELYLIGPRGASNLSLVEGHDEEVFQRLISLENVQWIGPVSWNEVPGWMAEMDALIIAYDSVNYLQKASNSHKLLEYFSSGKVILSSYLDDLGPEKDLILMTEAGQSVNKGMPLLLQVLKEGESVDRVEKRKAIAMENTYAIRTEQIFRLLQCG